MASNYDTNFRALHARVSRVEAGKHNSAANMFHIAVDETHKIMLVADIYSDNNLHTIEACKSMQLLAKHFNAVFEGRGAEFIEQLAGKHHSDHCAPDDRGSEDDQ